MATVVEGTGSRSVDWGTDLELSGCFVADNETYVLENNSPGEAHYLVAVLNPPILDALIKPSQTRGLFGARDIASRPLRLPTPRYNENDAAHQRLAELGQDCHSVVAAALPEIAARYRSTGRIRGEVRRLLAPHLAEIDGLVRGLLNLPSEGGA